MPMTITCADMGYSCGYAVTGDSMDQILSGVNSHALEYHDWTEEEIESADKMEAWKGAIRQSSRPDAIRTPRDESDRSVVPH
jgi:predicted small metal-binding protein